MLGFNHAFRGLSQMFRSERNFSIQFAVFLLVIATGLYLDISNIHWLVILLCSGLVLSLETINSAIERTCDLISKKEHPQIKLIKDLCAGAVLLASIFSAIIGAVIFYSYLFND